MICKNCGREIDDGAEICFACGQAVNAEQEDPSAVYALDDAEQPAQEESAVEQEVVVDNAPKAGKFTRFISFVFALIGLIIYGVKRKNDENSKAVSVANAILSGLCCKMALAICYCVWTFMIQRS